MMPRRNRVEYAFGHVTELGRWGPESCEDPTAGLTRAESVACVRAWLDRAPAGLRQLLLALMAGDTREAAAAGAGVDKRTAYRWLADLRRSPPAELRGVVS